LRSAAVYVSPHFSIAGQAASAEACPEVPQKDLFTEKMYLNTDINGELWIGNIPCDIPTRWPISLYLSSLSEEDRETYFADLGPDAQGPPTVGTKVSAVKSLHDLTDNHETRTVTIRRVSLFVL